jgi:hypothetical protein
MLPFFAILIGWLLMGMLTFRIWIRRCEVQNMKGVWKVQGWYDVNPWYDFSEAITLSFFGWPVILVKVVVQYTGLWSYKIVRSLFTLGLRLPEKESATLAETTTSKSVATQDNSRWA